ncbi:protein EPIDERMAL PATTERNING FACTOR 1-like protein [Cinnamomum micranthum f. kanehirae]|uniref:Epidermal patterning factor-like protein n=1 Tax=Cinnamomum micranthum f. kanehirae TaxID=337451 RepID=A0A3S3QWB5_9MAGN|nr:protein EPIDERMAL PATTERNING FACTOR 1-like protein [Cinnamomum micranthum f. kanehirae]
MNISIAAAAFVAFLLLPVMAPARDIGQPNPYHSHLHDQPTNPRVAVEGEMATAGPRRHDTVQVAGSSLPDCSHACGSCSPCRLVMVSFVCSLLAEAETCPVSYKCMCNSKSYPVP